MIAADGIDSPTTLALGELAEGVVFTSSGVATPGSRLEAFEDMFEQATGARPETIFNAAGYDLATIIKTAVMISGGTDSKGLQEAIVNMVDVQGVDERHHLQGDEGNSAALRRLGHGLGRAEGTDQGCPSRSGAHTGPDHAVAYQPDSAV